MPKLILVKHALPEVNSQASSHRWVLSEEGRRRCRWLADEIKTQKVSRLFSSLEPMALETAALVAVRTGHRIEPRPNLHENNRTGFGFVEQDELQQQFRMFFNHPTPGSRSAKRPPTVRLSASPPRSATSWTKPEAKI